MTDLDQTPPDVASQTEPAPPPVVGKKRRTRAAIARSNLARSKASERKVATYLRVSGWPGAERTVRTGYNTGDRAMPDVGDIDGTPGVVWQVKDTGEREWWRVPTWLAETNAQRIAAHADYGVLVVRRPGHAHAGEWWAWMWLGQGVALIQDASQIPTPGDVFVHGLPGVAADAPVRMELRHLLPVLRAAGYGTAAVAA